MFKKNDTEIILSFPRRRPMFFPLHYADVFTSTLSYIQLLPPLTLIRHFGWFLLWISNKFLWKFEIFGVQNNCLFVSYEYNLFYKIRKLKKIYLYQYKNLFFNIFNENSLSFCLNTFKMRSSLFFTRHPNLFSDVIVRKCFKY